MLHRPLRPIRIVRNAIHLLIAHVAAIRDASRTHRNLLLDNPSYATAVAAGAAAIVRQDDPRELLLAIATAVLATYAATRRALSGW